MSKASDQDVRDLLALLTTENEWITRQLERETREHEQTRRALAEAHAQITAWQGEAADHETVVNSLTVELMEAKARVERLQRLARANEDPDTWLATPGEPAYDEWDAALADCKAHGDLPDATERTHERV